MMMNNKNLNLNSLLLLCILIAASTSSYAQSVMLNGTIKYEKKVNLHKQMDAMSDGNSWAENFKKNSPKYLVSNFELDFNRNKSVYRKSKEQPPSAGNGRMGMMRPDDDKNITYKDADSNSIIVQKQVFEKLVLIQDSIPPIQWKLSNEFKKIADINCRKATAIILDSIFLIAYYTDAIITPSGPESVSGLPGMVLGLVIPRINTTYFATVVTPTFDEMDAAMIKPSKGDPLNYQKLKKQITQSTEDWGKKWKSQIIWGLYL
jgi:GLPGLI family protein